MSVRIICGHALTELRKLPDESVHCCVTSPPYFGLRDYGTAQWDGGDIDCSHSADASPRDTRPRNGLTGGTATIDASTVRRGDCRCGARRIDQQIGLEPSPDEYVAALVAVFREVRRVLRKDGTLWLNIGDSYAGANTVSWLAGNPEKNKGNSNRDGFGYVNGCKPKDLIGIPWLLAFALRNDGWWLRSDIIWSKPNPMPESVTDRPTKAHEYLFLLTKTERYYYDADAIREPISISTLERWSGVPEKKRPDGLPTIAFVPGENTCGANHDGRNKRSVWNVATAPYSEAHFATFPPALIEPCILAGCPEGGTVLDPFAGAGTTGLVADRLCRNALLIELNPAYAEMARSRIRGDAPLLTEVA